MSVCITDMYYPQRCINANGRAYDNSNRPDNSDHVMQRQLLPPIPPRLRARKRRSRESVRFPTSASRTSVATR